MAEEIQRQKYIKWTEAETRAVVQGVEKYGIGKWKEIKSDVEFSEILSERTVHQIKDKNRTLEERKERLLNQQKKEAEAKHQNEEVVKPPPTPNPFLSVEVSFCPASTKKMIQEMKLKLSVHEDTVLEEIIKEIKSTVVLSHNDCDLKLCSVRDNRIHKIIPKSKPIKDVFKLNLQAKEVHGEEESSIIAPVCHIESSTVGDNKLVWKTFGDPFLLVLHKGETLQDIKTRIQQQLHFGNEESSKCKIAAYQPGVEFVYVKESVDVYQLFKENEASGIHLGLEH